MYLEQALGPVLLRNAASLRFHRSALRAAGGKRPRGESRLERKGLGDLFPKLPFCYFTAVKRVFALTLHSNPLTAGKAA